MERARCSGSGPGRFPNRPEVTYMRRLYFALAAMTSWLMVLSLAPRAQSDLVRPRTGEAGVVSCNGHLQVAQNYDYGAQNAPRDDDNDNVETAPPPSDQPGDNEA